MGQSRLSRISKEELETAVARSETMRDLVVALGYGSSSGTMSSFVRRRVEQEGISLVHILEPPSPTEVGHVVQRRYTLDEILVEHSPYLNRYQLKIRLLRAGLLREECYECAMPPLWNGKPLTLQLDHVNGVNDDNRLENLRMLCPNCHSQTSTHSGRNKGPGAGAARRKPTEPRLRRLDKCRCGAPISKTADSCRTCFLKSRERTEWPSHGDLLALVDRLGFVKAGASLAVSDNAVRHRIRTNIRLKRVS